MFCGNCGSQIPNDKISFCSRCGANLKEVSAIPSDTPMPAPAVAQPAPQKTRRKVPIPLIVAGIFSVAAISAASIGISKLVEAGKDTNETGDDSQAAAVQPATADENSSKPAAYNSDADVSDSPVLADTDGSLSPLARANSRAAILLEAAIAYAEECAANGTLFESTYICAYSPYDGAITSPTSDEGDYFFWGMYDVLLTYGQEFVDTRWKILIEDGIPVAACYREDAQSTAIGGAPTPAAAEGSDWEPSQFK